MMYLQSAFTNSKPIVKIKLSCQSYKYVLACYFPFVLIYAYYCSKYFPCATKNFLLLQRANGKAFDF
jgi:hypothetical protein